MAKLLIGVMAVTGLGIGAAWASCETIARYGIYDTSLQTSDTERMAAFRTWFCQNQFSSQQEASDAGLDIWYKAFTLGYDQNNETWAEFSLSFCRDESFNSRFREQTLSYVRTINSAAVSALERCLAQSGLHAWIEQGGDDYSFRFQARFVPSSSRDPIPVVRTFKEMGAKCSPPLAEGSPIGPEGFETLCKRDGDGAVDIVFNASTLVTKNTPLSLKAVFQPPLPLTRRPIQIRAVEYVRSQDVAPASGEVAAYGSDVILNAAPYHARPNMVEYGFEATAEGRYILSAEYAAAVSRPVEIVINGQTVRKAGLHEATGCWEPQCQRWDVQGIVRLQKGENTMRIQRNNVFPHIRAFKFEPVD